MESAEKKLDFAYTPKEVVVWAYSTHVWNRIFPSGGNHNDYIKNQVDEMRVRGWDNDKILRMSSENITWGSRIRKPLPEIVISGHPINDEWDENEVRLALYRVVLDEVTMIKTTEFRNRIEGEKWTIDSDGRQISMLEGFIERLTQEATPTRGIRNR